MKVTYNSPIVLTFVLLSFLELCLGYVTGGVSKGFFSSSTWSGSVVYIFAHSGWEHYLGNMAYLLLLGPILEKKYGSFSLLVMILVTALLTSTINSLLFDSGIIGASGIVFMMIILTSMMNFREGSLPLTFVFIVLLYAGTEVVNSVTEEDISHFAHVFGGFMGGVLGIIFAPTRSDSSST